MRQCGPALHQSRGNLLALRHEVCTVLVIEDPGCYERECEGLRICEEYLQHCQQTDLLPDQRWVQLISLDRHGLGLRVVRGIT
jgi:hypothetical protein